MLSNLANLVTIWFSVASTFLALSACFATDKNKNFLLFIENLRYKISLSLASLIYFSFRFSSSVLGDKYFSSRSYFVSVLISASFGFITICIAYLTSNQIMIDDIRTSLVGIDLSIPVRLFFFSYIIIGLSIDFLSVTATRFILTFIRVDDKYTKVIFILAFDFVATNLIFVVGHGISYILLALANFLVFEHNYLHAPYNVLLDKQVFLDFEMRIAIFFQMFAEQYRSLFISYIIIREKTSDFGNLEVTFFVYPFSTMYATTFASSIWIYFAAICIFVAKLLSLLSNRILSSIKWIYENPGEFAVFSFLFCIVGFSFSFLIVAILL